jgi:hypothetical protein
LTLLANFENPPPLPVISFKDNFAILTLKMLTESDLRFCKIIPEAACDKLILAHFSCSQREVGAKERSNNHRERNSVSKHFQN